MNVHLSSYKENQEYVHFPQYSEALMQGFSSSSRALIPESLCKKKTWPGQPLVPIFLHISFPLFISPLYFHGLSLPQGK